LINIPGLNEDDLRHFAKKRSEHKHKDTINITVTYFIKYLKIKPNKSYNADETWYDIKFDDRMKGRNISEVKNVIDQMFQDLINKGRQEYHENDLIRFWVHHPTLDINNGIRLRELILSVIEKVFLVKKVVRYT
jgi:hypothetical protein